MSTACCVDRAVTLGAAVSSCGYLKVSCCEIGAEIFDLTIAVLSSNKDSPQVTLFNTTQMAEHTMKALLHIWAAKWPQTTVQVPTKYDEEKKNADY